MIHFNLKHINVIKNSKYISSNINEYETDKDIVDEYIIDLCNGFYLLPKKVPTTPVKINPRIFKPTNIDNLNKDSEADILDYIKGLLTIVSMFAEKIRGDVFGGNLTNTIFSIEELNLSDNQNPYILFSYKNYINFRVNITDYLLNDNDTFSIFTQTSFEDLNLNISKQKHILSLFILILCPPNFNNFFNFKRTL